MRFNASTTLQKKSQNGRSLYNYTCFGEKNDISELIKGSDAENTKRQRIKIRRFSYVFKYARMYINSSVKSSSLFWYYTKQIMNVFIRAMVRIFSFGER